MRFLPAGQCCIALCLTDLAAAKGKQSSINFAPGLIHSVVE
jgi:hypothetical protein